ncbi:MAG: hypothetical protein A3B53_01540 [Candidatus Levybacteria bacterium RIFCSPLOWO2_01_FULL_42_15]|nr:MAG: hypothetical protein A3B53_01540 [Candidatus Levybacteria bacterium RIFCSPLOWO2_01_FULL_42_15]
MKRKENMSLINTTWKHVRRSPYQSIAAILIVMQTFFVVSMFIFLIVGSSRIIAFLESQPQVTAFFENETKQEEMQVLKEAVKQTGKVSATKFVSKEEALKIYEEQNKDEPILLEFVTADILPASLEVSTYKIQDLSEIYTLLKNAPIVAEVIYQKDLVSKLTLWTNALRTVGITLIAVLGISSVLILVIVIGIKISQKKTEIEIMRLLGATSWYVRWPFIFEGMLYGVVGAVVAWCIASGILWYATPFLNNFLGGVSVLPFSPIILLEILAVEILLGILLGVFSSFLAVLRYLK